MKTFSLHHWDNSELPKLTIATTFRGDSWRAQTFQVHINIIASISGVIAVELNTFFHCFQSLTRTGLTPLVLGFVGWPSDYQLFLDLFFFFFSHMHNQTALLTGSQSNWLNWQVRSGFKNLVNENNAKNWLLTVILKPNAMALVHSFDSQY